MSGVDVPRDDGPGDGAPIDDLAAAYVVYTDGSCKPNPGPGGWAAAVAPSFQALSTAPSSRRLGTRPRALVRSFRPLTA